MIELPKPKHVATEQMYVVADCEFVVNLLLCYEGQSYKELPSDFSEKAEENHKNPYS